MEVKISSHNMINKLNKRKLQILPITFIYSIFIFFDADECIRILISFPKLYVLISVKFSIF